MIWPMSAYKHWYIYHFRKSATITTKSDQSTWALMKPRPGSWFQTCPAIERANFERKTCWKNSLAIQRMSNQLNTSNYEKHYWSFRRSHNQLDRRAFPTHPHFRGYVFRQKEPKKMSPWKSRYGMNYSIYKALTPFDLETDFEASECVWSLPFHGDSGSAVSCRLSPKPRNTPPPSTAYYSNNRGTKKGP